jgi:hypothetical protein
VNLSPFKKQHSKPVAMKKKKLAVEIPKRRLSQTI